MGIFELQSAYLKLCKFLCVVDVEIKWLFVQQVSFLIFMRVHHYSSPFIMRVGKIVGWLLVKYFNYTCIYVYIYIILCIYEILYRQG